MSAQTPFKTPSSSPPIDPDPTANGQNIRRAFAAEAVLNLFTLPLLFAPDQILSLLVTDSSAITPLACTLGRCFAALVVGALTPALLLGLPNSKRAIESRRTVYFVLGAGEAVLIPLLVWEASNAAARGALSERVCWAAVSMLLPPALARGWCLFVKPEVFGRYREVAETKRE